MMYLPPARITDFDRSDRKEELKNEWHNQIKDQIDSYTHLPRFLDPLQADGTAATKAIPWPGFPRIFDAWLDIENHPDQRERAYRSAELLTRYIYVKLDGTFIRTRPNISAGWFLVPKKAGAPSLEDAFTLAERPQDEYLEWHVVRDDVTKAVTRIDYTAEAPEYWETLAEGDGKLAATIYSELLKKTVPESNLFFSADVFCPELRRTGSGSFTVSGYVPLRGDGDDFKAGTYNRNNAWNTDRGCVHLTQRNNTLFAEINLAARATQRFAVRPDLDTEVDRFTLTACGGYGAVNRNSDPTIGANVNDLALDGLKVMVSNPIGLYIGAVDLTSFRDPNGKAVARDEILTIHRGTFEDEDGLARVLRFSVHPPADASYSLDRCTFDGFALTTGGPIASKTTVIIHGVAMPSTEDNPIVECDSRLCPHPTKRPRYYLTVSPDAPCPAADDTAWSLEPVPLAPELSSTLGTASSLSFRTTGSRS